MARSEHPRAAPHSFVVRRAAVVGDLAALSGSSYGERTREVLGDAGGLAFEVLLTVWMQF